MKKNQLIIGFVLLAILVLSRLIPHPYNFTALTGVALFSGSFWRGHLRFVVPLMATFLTDAYFGFYPGIQWTYMGIASIVLLSPSLNANVYVVGLRAFTAAILFFVFSNFGVWWSAELYPSTVAGLGACFTMAIPFFSNMLISSLFYALVFYSSYRVVFSEEGWKGFVKIPYGR